MKRLCIAGLFALSALLAYSADLTAAETGQGLYVTTPQPGDNATVTAMNLALQRALLDQGHFDVLTFGDLATVVSVTRRPMPHPDVCQTATADSCRQFGAQWHVDYALHLKLHKASVTVTLRHISTGATMFRTDIGADAASFDAGTMAQTLYDALLAWREARSPGPLPSESDNGLRQRPLQPRRIVWTWAGVGVTLATGIAAALVSAQAASKEDKFNSLVETSKTTPQSATLLNSYKQAADDHALAANVLWGITGAFAAATIVTFCIEYFLPPEDPGGGRRLVLSPAVGRDSLAVTLGGRF